MISIKLKSIKSRSKFSFALLTAVALVSIFASCSAEDDQFQPQNELKPQNEIIEESVLQRSDTIVDPTPIDPSPIDPTPPNGTNASDDGGIDPPTTPPANLPPVPTPPVKP